MARKRVEVTFTKAQVTPSKRKKRPNYIYPAKEPHGLSPLAAYIEDNRGNGISTPELIAQFQEYDCDHRHVERLATTAQKITTRCEDCGRIETKFRPGVK